MSQVIKDQEQIEQRILNLMDFLSLRFDIGYLKLNNSFSSKAQDADRIVCETLCDWEYRQATFVWNLHQVASMPDKALRDFAVHEIIHVLIAPLFNELPVTQQNKLAKNHELATENVARVISFVMDTP